MIHEAQVKLGYTQESVRLYYFKKSMEQLLRIEETTEEQFAATLEAFLQVAKVGLGEIRISHVGERYEILIPPTGVAYVYETYKENRFLSKLIEVLGKQNVTLEQIKEVFAMQSRDFVCEKVEGAEFDYVLYYNNAEIDEFYYCFSMGEMGAYYHRFTKEDYASIL